MIPAYDLFLAYAADDRGTASDLVNRLHGRVTVFWDGFLNAEDSFTTISSTLPRCRVFAILVSTDTWDGQHYASEELASAVEYARTTAMTIVPVWLHDIRVEKRPYGIATKVGISLAKHEKCLGCVAGKLVEVVLRNRMYLAEAEWSAQATRKASSILNLGDDPSELPRNESSRDSLSEGRPHWLQHEQPHRSPP